MEIAILGLGTVGMGAFEAAKRTDVLHVKRALIHNPKAGFESMTTTDFNTILNDESISIICECIGGLHPAYEYVMKALERGKHVITPNKQLISTYYRELTDCAGRHGVMLKYTSSAGGGIPWLFNLMRTKRCDEILSISGIINGTCNYILDRMTREGADFDEVLRDAQQAGYAEADPGSDIDGIDTLYKCAISANMAFGKLFKHSEIALAGISTITHRDICAFDESGCVCRLMMHAGRAENGFYAYVEPTLLPKGSLEAGVHDNYNLITLHGRNTGIQSFYGEGAGRMPTGTSVIQDALDIVSGGEAMNIGIMSEAQIDNNAVKHCYYLRKDSGSSVTDSITVAAAHGIYELARRESHDVFMAGIAE